MGTQLFTILLWAVVLELGEVIEAVVWASACVSVDFMACNSSHVVVSSPQACRELVLQDADPSTAWSKDFHDEPAIASRRCSQSRNAGSEVALVLAVGHALI